MSLAASILSAGATYTMAADILLVTDTQTGEVYSVDPVSGAKTQLLSGLNGPSGISSDSAGNVFISISGDGDVRKYPDSSLGSSTVLYHQPTNNLRGNATNSLGQIAVNYNGGTVQKVNTTTGNLEGSQIDFGGFGPADQAAVAFDSADNLYVGWNGSGPGYGIQKYDTSNTEITSFATNIGDQMMINGVHVSGSSFYYTQEFRLRKTDLNGVLDTNFGTGGTVSIADFNFGYGITSIGNTLYVLTGGSKILTFDATTGALLNANFSTGFSQAYNLTRAVAVPEPSTYALTGIATGVLAFMARRRKARKG